MDRFIVRSWIASLFGAGQIRCVVPDRFAGGGLRWNIKAVKKIIIYNHDEQPLETQMLIWKSFGRPPANTW